MPVQDDKLAVRVPPPLQLGLAVATTAVLSASPVCAVKPNALAVCTVVSLHVVEVVVPIVTAAVVAVP